MVFQDVALYPHMTVRDNMGFPLKVRGETGNYDERIEEVAESMEIGDLLDKKPGQLSGGQQQRVSLGRALVRDPSIILFDEPMSDLDQNLKDQLRVEFQRVHQEVDATIIWVTHDQMEAMTMSDQIGLMKDGNIVQSDKPDDLYNIPSSIFAAKFIGEPEMTVVEGEILRNGFVTFLDESIKYDLSESESNFLTDNDVGKYQIGFRPEDIILSDVPGDVIMPTKLEFTESRGRDSVLHLRTDNGLKINEIHRDPSIFDTSSLGIESFEKLYIFDPDSEELISQIKIEKELFNREVPST
jgi:multiple sugar transport system ATP-binding protein